jgi:hypothetical protein
MGSPTTVHGDTFHDASVSKLAFSPTGAEQDEFTAVSLAFTRVLLATKRTILGHPLDENDGVGLERAIGYLTPSAAAYRYAATGGKEGIAPNQLGADALAVAIVVQDPDEGETQGADRIDDVASRLREFKEHPTLDSAQYLFPIFQELATVATGGAGSLGDSIGLDPTQP